MYQYKSCCGEKPESVTNSAPAWPKHALFFLAVYKCALARAHLLQTENQKDNFYPEIKINHIFYSRFDSLPHKETLKNWSCLSHIPRITLHAQTSSYILHESLTIWISLVTFFSSWICIPSPCTLSSTQETLSCKLYGKNY